uniref:Uncharacterized protein n=1 Tax=Romanomermis culicivorax TaxID=13658 RepID=A0A915HZ58_ROMCU
MFEFGHNLIFRHIFDVVVVFFDVPDFFQAPNIGRRPKPNRLDHSNSSTTTATAYKSIDSYKIGRPCLPPLERRSCSLKSNRASISTITSDPRTSVCSLDAYKIINNGGGSSRRTSGYSTGRSSEMDVCLNGDSGKVVFEELDGYKQLVDPRKLQNHEYANLKGQEV